MLGTNDDMKVNLLSDGLSDSSCNLNVKMTKKKKPRRSGLLWIAASLAQMPSVQTTIAKKRRIFFWDIFDFVEQKSVFGDVIFRAPLFPFPWDPSGL